jgi:Tfp pilus assembly protein PilE
MKINLSDKKTLLILLGVAAIAIIAVIIYFLYTSYVNPTAPGGPLSSLYNQCLSQEKQLYQQYLTTLNSYIQQDQQQNVALTEPQISNLNAIQSQIDSLYKQCLSMLESYMSQTDAVQTLANGIVNVILEVAKVGAAILLLPALVYSVKKTISILKKPLSGGATTQVLSQALVLANLDAGRISNVYASTLSYSVDQMYYIQYNDTQNFFNILVTEGILEAELAQVLEAEILAEQQELFDFVSDELPPPPIPPPDFLFKKRATR